MRAGMVAARSARHTPAVEPVRDLGRVEPDEPADLQVRILQEEVVEPLNAPDQVPADLAPRTPFAVESIRAGLPEAGPFRVSDLRWFHDRQKRPNTSGDDRDAVLIFDGDCGFCTSAARWAERRFRHGERAEAWQLLGEEAIASFGLCLQDVEQAAWWVDDDGTRERGHRAAGRALQAGGGWRRGLGWLFLTPPTSWIAAGVYRLVVRWRYRLPGGTPACRLDGNRRASSERPGTTLLGDH